MRETATCVRCLRRHAMTWCGYVVQGAPYGKERRVLAGWCHVCWNQRDVGDTPRFVGHWKRQMTDVPRTDRGRT